MNYFAEGVRYIIMKSKREVAAALAKSEEKYKRLFSAIRDPMFLLDYETGAILDINEAACLLYGYNREEMLALKDIDLSAKPAEKVNAMSDISAHIPIRSHKKKDGTVFPLEITASTIVLDGRITIIASMRDISHCVKMENNLVIEREMAKKYLDLASIMFLILGRTGIVTSINKEGCEILGYEEKDVLGKYWFNTFIPAHNAPEIKQLFKKIISGEKETTKFYENAVITSSGKKRIISWHNSTLKDKNGYITGVLCAGCDVTDKKNAEDALIESEKRLLAAQSMAQVGNWEIDLSTKMLWASKEAFNIYEIESQDGFMPLDLIQASVLPDYRNMLNTALTALIARNKKYDIQYKIRTTKTGKEKFLHSLCKRVVDESGRAIKLVGTVQDITEQKKLEERLEYMGYHDQLTGLYNRRFFEKEIGRLDTLDNLPLSAIMFDINGLKLTNDSFGHAVGDKLLIKSAEVLTKGCRSVDTVFRLGGDEFVIILPKTETNETVKIANHIKDLVAKEKNVTVELSISYGYDTKRMAGESIHEILANAESYMYRHKLYEHSSMRSKAIDIVMSTLFEKSHRESRHSVRVSEICMAIASRLNFDNDELKRIKTAGLVHDIGKIGINEQILNKAGNLSSDERYEMEKHSEIGWRILSSNNEFSELAHYILNHHEKWDGTGYPHNVKGEDIPIEARIIAVADAYDAMTSERSYRPGICNEAAKEEITRCSGTHFDPEIADVFVNQVLLDS